MMKRKRACPVRILASSVVFQHQEVDSFFRLFDEELIQDFLRMDRCYKMTDKYLLAMTFVYFKRACFSTAEYTWKNFFIALYLANTMEEDEEKYKYEIFPWALGKNWRRKIPCFLRQRDSLWARIKYRAAVSKRCCEMVMAIRSSHSIWLRQRSDDHSGAQRDYDSHNATIFPRGPATSPASCARCHPGRLSLEVTPPCPAVSQGSTGETNSQTRHLSWFSQEEVPRNYLACEFTHDLLMDLFHEE